MVNFFIGVLSSIIAALICFIIGRSFKHSRKWVVTILNTFLKTDISNIYRTKRDAEKDICLSISKSSTVRLFVSRGNELQRETYSKLFETPQKFKAIKVLLPNPKASSDIDWLDAREREIIIFDKAYAKNSLRNQVQSNIDFVNNVAKNNNNFELRLYNLPHIGLVTITDDSAYYYFLKTNAHGRDSKMYKCNANTELYECLSRYFDHIWENQNTIK